MSKQVRTLATDELIAILGTSRREAVALVHDWLLDLVHDGAWITNMPRGPLRGTFRVALTWEADAVPRHLDLDAPPLAQCSACQRSTWAESDVGRVCGMPQPDGHRCAGQFLSSSAPPPAGGGG